MAGWGVEEIGCRWGRAHACWRSFRTQVPERPNVSWRQTSGVRRTVKLYETNELELCIYAEADTLPELFGSAYDSKELRKQGRLMALR